MDHFAHYQSLSNVSNRAPVKQPKDKVGKLFPPGINRGETRFRDIIKMIFLTTDDHPLWLWFTYFMMGWKWLEPCQNGGPQHLRCSARGVLMALAVTWVTGPINFGAEKWLFRSQEREFLRDHVTTVAAGGCWMKQIFWICFDQISHHVPGFLGPIFIHISGDRTRQSSV